MTFSELVGDLDRAAELRNSHALEDAWKRLKEWVKPIVIDGSDRHPPITIDGSDGDPPITIDDSDEESPIMIDDSDEPPKKIAKTYDFREVHVKCMWVQSAMSKGRRSNDEEYYVKKVLRLAMK